MAEDNYTRLASLADEGQLLSIVGSATLTPEEQSWAALRAFAPDELEGTVMDGLFGKGRAIDLADRGRRVFDQAIKRRGDSLRRSLCPLYSRHADEREIVIGATPILTEEFNELLVHSGHQAPIAVAAAILLARYGMAKLCEDYPPSDGANA